MNKDSSKLFSGISGKLKHKSFHREHSHMFKQQNGFAYREIKLNKMTTTMIKTLYRHTFRSLSTLKSEYA